MLFSDSPGTFVGVIAATVAGIAFVRSGLLWRDAVSASHLRGRSLRSRREAVSKIAASRTNTDPGFRLGRHLFASRLASGHIAIVGATGSGKTILQRLLLQSVLPRIRKGGTTRALVYDAKQDMLGILAGMAPDCPIHILNPLDQRAVAWNMAADITSPASALQMAHSLVPEAKNDNSPFFANAARHLLNGVLTSFMLHAPASWTFRHLLLVARDTTLLREALSRSELTRHLLQYFTHEGTLQNIVSTLLTHTAPYEIIAAAWDRASGRLSLRDWVHNDSVLVLGNDEENRSAIETINRLVFRRITELILAKDEVGAQGTDRSWFFLDEVREAGRLDGLSRLLTKGRSKGAAVVLGFQDVNGLHEVYGREVGEELLGQCNSKIVLRLNSPETADWASRLFGSREVLETSRNQSRSRNSRGIGLDWQSSSGVSLSNGITKREVVLDSEFMNLPETTPDTGLSGFYLTPPTGGFLDHIPGTWIDEHLIPAHPKTANITLRPDSEQYLRPWGEPDWVVLGRNPSAPPLRLVQSG